MRRMFMLAGLGLCAHILPAQENKDKSAYWLLRPVPHQLMRSRMDTDRPDVTESPYTVDAGHIQYECDLVRYKQSKDEKEINRQWLANAFNLKIGLTNNTDLQVNLETYRHEVHEERTDHERQQQSNTGSVLLRLKQNLYGNDKGKFAIAVMPYVKLPTHDFFDHHAFEGGIIVPFQFKLPSGWSLGMQVEMDALKTEDNYEGQLLQSVTLSHSIFKNMKGIGETYATYNFVQQEWENFFNIAFQYNVYKNFAFDAGFIYGIQEKAEHDYFLGLSFRF